MLNNSRHLARCFMMILVICGAAAAHAAAPDTLTDVYTGIIPSAISSDIVTTLTLRHLKYSDEGSFELLELQESKRTITSGDWTVLRGDAVNKNATVIELYNSHTNTALKHYLRLKNGNIKMLDEKLRTIKSKGNYLLKKKS